MGKPETSSRIQALRANIGRAFVGREDVVTGVVVGLLAGGHILIEDLPGVGKTTLARTLARSIDLPCRRIQFTPDLLPADILGVSVYDPDEKIFVFREGPLFANIILADELNRTTPRTQSALLEAMNEGQVSIEGVTRRLPEPFMILATMNPVESRGTFELPESQLDRFLLKIEIGKPDPTSLRRILREHRSADPVADLRPVMTGDDVLELQKAVKLIRVEEILETYVIALIEATFNHPELSLGASPRAALALVRAAQALSLIRDRDYVTPDDVKALAVPVLAHRVLARGRGAERPSLAILDILQHLPVPT